MSRNTRSQTGASSGARCMRSTRANNQGSAPDAFLPASFLPIPSPDDSRAIKCQYILKILGVLKLGFGELVDAISYGDPELRQPDGAQAARKSLYKEDTLRSILENLYSPPRCASGGGARPIGGSKIITHFIFDVAQRTFASELNHFSSDYRISDEELTDMDHVSTITTDALHEKVKECSPRLYATLCALRNTNTADKPSDVPDDRPAFARHPYFDVIAQVTSMAYKHNRRRNTLQKVLAVYTHAKHTPKAVIDLLQQVGLSMSYSWVRENHKEVSEQHRMQMIEAARSRPICIVHDNIWITAGVSDQRGTNHAIGDNGTAGTLLVLPAEADVLERPECFEEFNRQLKLKQLAGTAPKLTHNELDTTQRGITNRTGSIHDILDIFRAMPELANSRLWDSEQLKRPLGDRQLPHGPDHWLKQFMMTTANIDESTYSGNAQYIDFALRDLGLDTESEEGHLLKRLIIWIGDQMTVQRCRQVKGYRREAVNSQSRLESFMFFFGGFHGMLALARAILERYRGASVGPGFDALIIALSRTGLQKQSSSDKRLDFHTVDEFLQQTSESLFRDIFDKITGCQTSDDRTEWAKTHSADDLYSVARRALLEYASSGALELIDPTDEVLRMIVQRNRDLLLYRSTRRAFKYGDIDRIDALLPELLFFYAGTGCPNYAREIFELLQFLTHESTPEIRDIVLRCGLVVNRLGRADSFYPIDQHQELNNKGLREYGPPPQHATWEQYGRASHVIPFYIDIIEHVEHNISGLRRSRVHKATNYEQDLQVLLSIHQKYKVHIPVSGRKINAEDQAKETVGAGVLAVRDRQLLEKYHAKRDVFLRAVSNLQVYQSTDTPSPSPRAHSPESTPAPSPPCPITPVSQLDSPSPSPSVFGGTDNIQQELEVLASRMAELVLQE